jgi:hypothetical protein
LDEVRGRQAAVVETKRSVAEQLDEVQGLLEKSKHDWRKTRTEYGGAATTPAANEVNTGGLPAFSRHSHPDFPLQIIIFSLSFRVWTPSFRFLSLWLSLATLF